MFSIRPSSAVYKLQAYQLLHILAEKRDKTVLCTTRSIFPAQNKWDFLVFMLLTNLPRAEFLP